MPKTLPLAVSIAFLGACGGEPEGGSRPGDVEALEVAGSALNGEILVSAAASLTDAFAEIESVFEAAHPAVEVTLNLAGSSTLRAQILEGAPVDVFASADRSNMEHVADAGEVAGEARIFAGNRLQIAVPPGNPGDVARLGDLAREELWVGLCAEDVPCGRFARRALARSGVVPAIDTTEPDVRALLTKVELGELDAAVTYVTDVSAAEGAVEGIDIPRADNIVIEYPIAVLSGAPNPEAARAFVGFVLSTEGRAVLARHGFVSP